MPIVLKNVDIFHKRAYFQEIGWTQGCLVCKMFLSTDRASPTDVPPGMELINGREGWPLSWMKARREKKARRPSGADAAPETGAVAWAASRSSF